MSSEIPRARRPLTVLVLLAPLLVFALSLAVRAQQQQGPMSAGPLAPQPVRMPTRPQADAGLAQDAAAPVELAEAGVASAPVATPPSPAPPPGPRRVYVGIYPFHVPQLDLSTNSYLVDFWLWFRWQGSDIEPSRTFEFMNLYEAWNGFRRPVYVDAAGAAHPDALGDGWFYQVLHVQAHFAHPFNVRAYPFDHQEIVLTLEDSESTVEDLVYVVDQGSERLHPTLELPGWRLAGAHASVRETLYLSSLGDPRRPVGTDRFSQFHYSIQLERPVLGYAGTTILPVAIVIMITFVMFAIQSKYFEARLGLGITSLISAVALQLTTGADLPKTGYLVLLDHVYNLSYLVIFLSLLVSVRSVRLWDTQREDASRRLDRWAVIVLSALFFGGTGLLIALR